MLEKLQSYFAYDFVRFALVVGVLVALCAALLGVTLVLRRYSMIGDGLSHMAFGAMTVAMLFSIAPIWLTLPVTVVSAVLLLRSGGKLKGDAAVAMLSVSSLAMGYLLLNIFKNKSANLSGDVCAILFGSTSILTLKKSDVVLCAVLAAVVIFVYIFFYNKIFAVTFDESFARATGTNASLYNTLLAVITAVVIVLSMNLVGALLISALIVFPALCGMRLFRSFRGVIVSASVISVCCALGGILISILYGTPVGSTIVAADLAVFLVCVIIDLIKGGRKA
jgi:zinc transport system permease protein